MKILHVAETIRGGIATYFNELHAHQCGTFGAANVHYVIPANHRNDLTGFEDSSISGFSRTGRNIASLVDMASVTMREMKRIRPDIIHLHSTFAGLIIRPLLFIYFGYKPKVVYCPHGWSFSRKTTIISQVVTKLTERLLTKTADRIICISYDEYNSARTAGVDPERLVVVRNGINTARVKDAAVRQSPWTAKGTRVLFIGRLDHQKGFDLLIEAARHLGELIDLRMIGSAVVGEEKSLDLPQNVTLLGWMDRVQIDAQLDQADLVVIPSRWEAFGLVALEAMRASKPIVAFNIGALPELIEDGVTGILCPHVSVDGLIAGIKAATALDLGSAGKAGRARLLQYFDVKRTHAALTQLYAHLKRSDEFRESPAFSGVGATE